MCSLISNCLYSYLRKARLYHEVGSFFMPKFNIKHKKKTVPHSSKVQPFLLVVELYKICERFSDRFVKPNIYSVKKMFRFTTSYYSLTYIYSSIKHYKMQKNTAMHTTADGIPKHLASKDIEL